MSSFQLWLETLVIHLLAFHGKMTCYSALKDFKNVNVLTNGRDPLGKECGTYGEFLIGVHLNF